MVEGEYTNRIHRREQDQGHGNPLWWSLFLREHKVRQVVMLSISLKIGPLLIIRMAFVTGCLTWEIALMRSPCLWQTLNLCSRRSSRQAPAQICL